MSLPFDHPDFSFARHEGYYWTSPATADYNCIAWAAGDTGRKWWPIGRVYWPKGAPRHEALPAFAAAFATLGYAPCDSTDLEPGYEKVAIFTKSNAPTHAARQLVSGPHQGLWTSKLGDDIDVAHRLPAVGGTLYGSVAMILRRKCPE
jgi:hypothetical protein